jgi:hypothetical protein
MTLEQAITVLSGRTSRMTLNCPSIVGVETEFWTALRTVAWAAIEERDGMKYSEENLVLQVQAAFNDWRWTLGQCATEWVDRYARGRTLAEFAMLAGVTSDQAEQSEKVWRQFAHKRKTFPELRWSHFYAAIAWTAQDALHCLHWANETRSTVAEMRAWRWATRGEDLTVAELT